MAARIVAAHVTCLRCTIRDAWGQEEEGGDDETAGTEARTEVQKGAGRKGDGEQGAIIRGIPVGIPVADVDSNVVINVINTGVSLPGVSLHGSMGASTGRSNDATRSDGLNDRYADRWGRAIRLSLDPSITHNTKTMRAVAGIFDLLLGVSTAEYDSGSLGGEGGEGGGEDGEGGLLPTAADRDALLCIAASIRTAPSFHLWTQLCLLHGTCDGTRGWTSFFQC